ncbi:MAG: hypothetical protein ACK44S_07435 [Bacteroidota bacterium]|jgi:hypothetical protein
MDIASYIGQFLLRNKYCYLHGIGSLKLNKLPKGDAGSYVYHVQLLPGGSIDDLFANFVATSEQVSISKAANAIREYNTEIRSLLDTQQKVIIPTIGYLVKVDNHYTFVTDDNFSYQPSVNPALKFVNAKPIKEATTSDEIIEETPQKAIVNWSKIILFIALLLVAGIAIYFIATQSKNISATQDQPIVNTTTEIVAPAIDTAVVQPDTLVTNTEYKFLIKTYSTLGAAVKRYQQLLSYGNKVGLQTSDSISYQLYISMPASALDTTQAKDSLRVIFNPKGTISIIP